jgi:hypothetical protein
MASSSAKVAIGRKVPINYQKTSPFLGVSSHLNVYPLMSKLACSEQDFYLVLIILIKWDFTHLEKKKKWDFYIRQELELEDYSRMESNVWSVVGFVLIIIDCFSFHSF